MKLLALPGRPGGAPLSKIVGMTVVGPMAGEQIAEGALAMRSGMYAFRLAQVVKAYPTWSIATRVAAARLFRSQDGVRARPAPAERVPLGGAGGWPAATGAPSAGHAGSCRSCPRHAVRRGSRSMYQRG